VKAVNLGIPQMSDIHVRHSIPFLLGINSFEGRTKKRKTERKKEKKKEFFLTKRNMKLSSKQLHGLNPKQNRMSLKLSDIEIQFIEQIILARSRIFLNSEIIYHFCYNLTFFTADSFVCLRT
jgi:hypothetical protein